MTYVHVSRLNNLDTLFVMSSFSFIFRTPFETIIHEDIEWLSLDTA